MSLLSCMDRCFVLTATTPRDNLSYTYQLSRQAEKSFARLDTRYQRLIVQRLDRLAEGPYDTHFSKQLANRHGLRTSRVGDYRILYSVDEALRALLVKTIGPRGSAYRDG